MNRVILSEEYKYLPVFEVGQHDFKIMEGMTDSRMQSFYTLHIVLSGEGVFNINDRTYNLSAGHIFLTPPEKVFSYYPDDKNPWCYVWFAFRDEAYLKPLNSFGLNIDTAVYHTNELIVLENIFDKLFNQTSENSVPYESAVAFYSMISIFVQEKAFKADGINLPKSYVRKAMELIAVNYNDPSFNVLKLCKIMYISHSYLSRIFKSVTGVSLSEHIITVRYKTAAQMLADTDLTVSQISISVGVRDEIHFYKQFKRIWKMTPDAYRRMAKSKGKKGLD